MTDRYKKVDPTFVYQMEEYLRALLEEFEEHKEDYYEGRLNGPWHPTKILLELSEGLSYRIRKHVP